VEIEVASLELICCRLVQSFCLADVVPTLLVSDSSERDGVSKFVSSLWGLVKLGGCNRRVCSLLVFVIVAYHGEPGHGCVFVDVFYPGCAHVRFISGIPSTFV
ncbi:hypothetical protein HID58_035281, partial [Brassica napus]